MATGGQQRRPVEKTEAGEKEWRLPLFFFTLVLAQGHGRRRLDTTPKKLPDRAERRRRKAIRCRRFRVSDWASPRPSAERGVRFDPPLVAEGEVTHLPPLSERRDPPGQPSPAAVFQRWLPPDYDRASPFIWLGFMAVVEPHQSADVSLSKTPACTPPTSVRLCSSYITVKT